MTVSFENSMRSLQANDPRKTLIGLVVAIVLMLAWLAWFVLAQVSLYEVSNLLEVTGEDVIQAKFPLGAQNKLKAGQTATLRINGDVGSNVGSVSGLVLDVNKDVNQNLSEASILIKWADVGSSNLQQGMTGYIEVETEKISPASLVIRSARSAITNAPTEDEP